MKSKLRRYNAEREVPPPPKPPWKISASVFAPRMRECDAKSYFDTHGIQHKACDRDWSAPLHTPYSPLMHP